MSIKLSLKLVLALTLLPLLHLTRPLRPSASDWTPGDGSVLLFPPIQDLLREFVKKSSRMKRENKAELES